MSLGQHAHGGCGRGETETEVEVADETTAADRLELLDTEYTRHILEAIRSEAKPARELVEECGASRPTVYRRLNDLEAAGLVASDMAYDADGHHRTVFEATLESVSVDVTADGLSVSVTTGTANRPSTRPTGLAAGD